MKHFLHVNIYRYGSDVKFEVMSDKYNINFNVNYIQI